MFFDHLIGDSQPVADSRHGKIALYQGDCREVLKRLPADSVHCVVTSPPYYGLRDYGHGDQQIGREDTPQQYVQNLVEVFREVKRVLRPDGTLWLNLGDSHANKTIGLIKQKDLIGIPWMVAFALRDDGWYLRQGNIWAKRSIMPESTHDRTTTAHEHIFHLTKSAKYFYDYTAIEEIGDCPPGTIAAKGSVERAKHANGRPPEYKVYSGKRNKRSVWRIGKDSYSGTHYAKFPREIPAICIKAGTSAKGCCPKCGAPYIRQFTPTATLNWSPPCKCNAGDPIPCTVLDPFAGSGTTALVASELGRDSIMIELSDEYILMICQRCALYPVYMQPTIQRRPMRSSD